MLYVYICTIAYSLVRGQVHWANLKKLIDIMDAIEKQANKKYDQLQVLNLTSTPQTSKVLNEMEDL